MSVNNIERYTNGAYVIEGRVTGFWRFAKVFGEVVESKYQNVYRVGTIGYFNLYGGFWDKKPQFIKVIEEDVGF